MNVELCTRPVCYLVACDKSMLWKLDFRLLVMPTGFTSWYGHLSLRCW